MDYHDRHAGTWSRAEEQELELEWRRVHTQVSHSPISHRLCVATETFRGYPVIAHGTLGDPNVLRRTTDWAHVAELLECMLECCHAVACTVRD